MSYDSELYKHDLDRKAFDALSKFPKLLKLQEAYSANVDEKAAKIEMLSTAIRLSENQLPEIYNLLPPICEKLGITIPELYMRQSVDSKDLNAFTFGSTNPIIVVTSELIKQLEPEKVASVIAHECGHIACKHSLYRMLAHSFINGINESPLYLIPAVRKYITPSLVKALLFWDRCSELSADRAAVLCDGSAEKTIDALLKIHGFDDSINREEFIKQALDLKAFVNDSKSNAVMEQMIVQWDSHPLLATRAYQCYDWAQSEEYKGIIDGTITIAALNMAELEETNAIELEVSSTSEYQADISPDYMTEIDKRLEELNTEIDRYTCNADKYDYSIAVGSGLLTGLIDTLFAGEFDLQKAHEWGSEKTESFVKKVAKWQGYEGNDLNKAIIYLAERKTLKSGAGFHLASDSNTMIFGGPLQHHLRDFAHHPNVIGLVFSMLTQFTGKCYGTDTSGAFLICDVKEDTYIGKDLGQKFLFGTVYWFFHMVSDIAGSGIEDSEGTGVPGTILSLAKVLSSTPLFKGDLNDKGNRTCSVLISKMFNGTMFGERDKDGKLIPLRLDFRTELGIFNHVKKEVMVLLLNESIVRAFFLIRRLLAEVKANNIFSISDFDRLDYSAIMPFDNRTIDRMILVASMTFNVVDTADAAMRAAVESGGNWVIFSGRFVARYNFVGAGRTAIAIVKEVSNEKKEAQLIHERMLLMNAKAQIMYMRLQEFKAQLDERLTNYLAEDIMAFMEGFDYINEGLASGDSDKVIHGNVIIQRVLGREPQFTTQKEFDALMDSDEALQL